MNKKRNYYEDKNREKLMHMNVSTDGDATKDMPIPEKNDMHNFKKADKKVNKRKNNLKLTAQQTIPYKRIFKNGMIETVSNTYVKAYRFKDINFKIIPREQQESMYLEYEKLLNSFDSMTQFQVFFNNKSADKEDILKEVVISPRMDDINNLRSEYNDVLSDKMDEGTNNLVSEKYLVVSTECKTPELAKTTFARIDSSVSQLLKPIVKDTTEPLKIEEYIKLLHDVCNPGHEKAYRSLTLEEMYKKDLSSKDIIASGGFDFAFNSFTMGEKYARVLFIKDLPSTLSTDFVTELMGLPLNMCTSVYYKGMSQNEAISKIKNKNFNVRSDVGEAQKTAIKNNYSPELISPDLIEAQEEIKNLMDDVMKRNQKIFMCTVLVMHCADTLEQLNEDTKTIKGVGNRFLVNFDTLMFQQENGFDSVLPLCINKTAIKTPLTTETSALFFPFSTKELFQEGGMYYGLNAVSKNLIILNRRKSKNQNGMIFGVPGSGKSFAAKQEMTNILLSTDDDVYVIDPEGEYSEYAKAFPTLSEIVMISPSSKNYLNPFDINLNYAANDDGEDEDPIAMKSDYITGLIETIMGGTYGLSTAERTIIDRCVRILMTSHLNELYKKREINPNITSDITSTPTLDDFRNLLMNQPELEAKNIGLALELYVTGSFQLFSHKTNVNTSKRFVVFNTKNIGTNLAELGSQVCLNYIWNKMIDNKSKRRRTWLFIDEMHLFTKRESTMSFLNMLFARDRKWGGSITGITQNVETLLQTVVGRGILGNCEFICMLSQSAADRMALQSLYQISDAQLEYITDAGPGVGLIYNGSTILPFINDFPKNTKLYSLLTTKFEDIKKNA